MFDFHEKRKIRQILYSKAVFALLTILTALLLIAVYNRFTVAQETKEKLEERRADLEALETRAEVLNAKVDHLEEERGIEEELRNRFNVAKEGEQVVVIIDQDGEETKLDDDAPRVVSDEEGSGLRAFFKLFKFW